MTLKNDVELSNTRGKLAELEDLMQKREQDRLATPAGRLSQDSMQRFAGKLRAEIQEYEKSHQTA